MNDPFDFLEDYKTPQPPPIYHPDKKAHDPQYGLRLGLVIAGTFTFIFVNWLLGFVILLAWFVLGVMQRCKYWEKD